MKRGKRERWGGGHLGGWLEAGGGEAGEKYATVVEARFASGAGCTGEDLGRKGVRIKGHRRMGIDCGGGGVSREGMARSKSWWGEGWTGRGGEIRGEGERQVWI